MKKSLRTCLSHLLDDGGIPINWVKRTPDAWLSQQFGGRKVASNANLFSERIEEIATSTNQLGPQALWEGYPQHKVGETRSADDVRTSESMGNFYSELVQRKKPGIIVEFGAAFGVSGMYWLAGIELNNSGRLLSFEPNQVWAGIARENLARISQRFTLECGTFEENVDKLLGATEKIDIAFIDAIHTTEFVNPQLDLVVLRCNPGAIILLDDINFSADMRTCWDEISREKRFSASASLGERVGVVELAAVHSQSKLSTPRLEPMAA